MGKKFKILPTHIGIIMDGNGRWAQKRNLPRYYGHKEGIESVRRVVKTAKKYGVKYLTLYSFSTENWKRPKEEVEFLFKLMEERLKKEGEKLNKQNVRVRFIGNRKQLPQRLQKIMGDVEELTKNNNGFNLTFAINYGGREEILQAIKKVKKYKIKDLNEDNFKRYLYTKDLPDPDIIVRTAGEKRISNFLLWQSSYSEFYFTKTLWPDFSEEDFLKVLSDYQRRKRKFGGLT